MSNLYWPIYKNLESELSKLSDCIRICDKQLSVFSDKILELLLRCSIEIESIAKDLFLQNCDYNSKKDLYFDTDCINFLNDTWKICSKRIIVSSSNFYLENDENIYLTPLYKANKRGSSGCDWKRAYQDIKHNRIDNMEKANLKHFIRALAALYILNVYYKNEKFEIKNSKDDSFQSTLSNIFTFYVHNQKGYDKNNEYIKGENYDCCIYLTKWKKEDKEKIDKWNLEVNKNINKELLNHPKILDFIHKNFIVDGNLDISKLQVFFSENKYFELFDFKQELTPIFNKAIKEATHFLGFSINSFTGQFEAVLNI